jgi:acyl-CoA thioester hydrolase
MAEGAALPEPGELNGYFISDAHIQPVRVYYEDTDASGIVYYGNYVRFIERGRSNYLRLIGINHQDLMAKEEPLAFTVVRLEIDYKVPARLDDRLEVHTKYTKVTGARIYGSQIVKRGDVELVRAEIQAACINLKGKPRRLPLYVREALAQHVATD